MLNVTRVARVESEYAIARLQHRLSAGWQRSRRSVLVNGSPKSGTTWMVKLMASLPGYRGVGNFHHDFSRYLAVQPGDVIHGHERYTPELASILRARAIKVILMIRDPRDQAISHMFHLRRTETHPAHGEMIRLSEDDALMACIEGRPDIWGSASMLRLTRSWLDAGDQALCVRYEDLNCDPVGEFGRVLQFLGIDCDDHLRRAIVRRNSFERSSIGRRIWQSGRRPGNENTNSFFRKGIVGDWKNYFKASHIERFKEVAGDELINLGYEQDRNW